MQHHDISIMDFLIEHGAHFFVSKFFYYDCSVTFHGEISPKKGGINPKYIAQNRITIMVLAQTTSAYKGL